MTERTGGISIVGGDEEVTTGEEMDRGDGAGNIELLGDGVCRGSHSLACLGREQVVHPGVAALDGRVSGEEVREVRVSVAVNNGELMIFEWSCEWEERIEGRRQRGGVSYSPLGQTLHVSIPAQLSRSLPQPSILSIRSRTCMPTGNHGDVRSSQSRILLHLLLNRAAELGSSGHGPRFLGKA